MTDTEAMLLALGILMLAASGLVYARLHRHPRLAAGAVLVVVILFMCSANRLGLLA